MFLRSRRLGAAIVALACALTVGACGSSSSGGNSSTGSSSTPSSATSSTPSSTSSGSSGGAYKIGFTDSLTGALSVFTQPELKWAKAVFDTVNAQGGINGHKIEVTALDQGATGSGQATANVTQLATQDHVSAILGMLISNDCTSAAAVADRYQTPLICQRASASSLLPVNKYVFLDTDAETMEVTPQMSFIKTLLPGKSNIKVAVMNSGETGAQLWAARWKADAPKNGFSVTTVQEAAETATNMNSQIAAVVASKPQVIVTEIFPQFFQPLLAALKAAHLNVPIVTTSGDIFGSMLGQLDYPQLYETTIAKPLTVGAASNTAEQNALIKQLKAQGMTTTEKINDVEGTMYAPGPYAVVAALQKCGYPCPGPKMASTLESTSTTVAGLVPNSFGYTPSLHIGVKDFVFMHWDAKKKALAIAATKPAGAFHG